MQLQIDISNIQISPPESRFPITIPKIGPILLELDPANLGVMDADTLLAKHEILLPGGKKIVISFNGTNIMEMKETLTRVSQCVIGGGMCQESFTYVFTLDSAFDNSIQLIDTRASDDMHLLANWGVRCEITAGSK